MIDLLHKFKLVLPTKSPTFWGQQACCPDCAQDAQEVMNALNVENMGEAKGRNWYHWFCSWFRTRRSGDQQPTKLSKKRRLNCTRQKSKTSSDSQAPLEFVPLSIPRILEWPPNPDEHLLLGKDLHIQKTFNSGTTSATIRNSLGISKRDLRLQPSARGPPPLPLINADTFLEWYRHNKPLPAPPSTFSAYPSSNYESLYVKDDFKRRASVASSSTFISTTPMSEYNYESSRVLDELIDELMMRPTSTPPDQTYYAITINHYESANNSTTRCSNPRHNDMSWPSCAPTHMLVMVGNTFGAFKSRETLIDGNGFVIPRCDDFGFTPYDLFWVRDSSGPFYLRSYLQIQAEKLNVLWFKDKSLGHVYAVKFSARASLYAPPTGTQWVDRIGPDYEAVPTLPLERY